MGHSRPNFWGWGSENFEFSLNLEKIIAKAACNSSYLVIFSIQFEKMAANERDVVYLNTAVQRPYIWTAQEWKLFEKWVRKIEEVEKLQKLYKVKTSPGFQGFGRSRSVPTFLRPRFALFFSTVKFENSYPS
mgnify:CR=1 FL=1